MSCKKFKGHGTFTSVIMTSLLGSLPRFRFQVQGQKRKCGIGRKCFTTCFTVRWTSLGSSKGLLGFLSTQACFIDQLGSGFILKSEATTPILHSIKEQKDGNFFTTCLQLIPTFQLGQDMFLFGKSFHSYLLFQK